MIRRGRGAEETLTPRLRRQRIQKAIEKMQQREPVHAGSMLAGHVASAPTRNAKRLCVSVIAVEDSPSPDTEPDAESEP